MPARPVFEDPPVLCGHRGIGRGVVDGRRENTIASFRAAVAAGLRWVEVDARRTADDVLVASHDPVVADGRFISELDSSETDVLGLVRVADVLADLPPGIGVDLDVKSSLEDALLERGATTAALAAELAGPEGERRTLLVTSFDPSVLPIVRERAPALPLGLLTWGRFPLRKAIPAAVHLGVEVVAAHFGSFPLGDSPLARVEREAARSVAVAHQAGLQVATWCPRRAEAELLAAAGVDCLVVDHDVVAAGLRGAGARARR
jgi:glycerophosphoryl diester phosphodiesterase